MHSRIFRSQIIIAIQKMNDRLPDSDEYIARLEAKLNCLKTKNQTQVNGKTLIKSMAEFREIYTLNAFQNNLSLNQEENLSESSVNVTYVQRLISPVQQINTEESKSLVENDWLQLAQQGDDVVIQSVSEETKNIVEEEVQIE